MDVCEACGERNPAGSAFCVYCGVYLGWDQRAADDRSAVPTTTDATAATAATAQPGQPSGMPAGSPYDVTAPHPTVPQPTVPQPTVPEPTVPQAAGAPVPSGQAPCPACGNPNPASRRFCGKCGQALRPGTGTAGVYQRQQQRRSWWQRFRDPVDRKARRDYRHSLPPLYRYRRVLIALLGLLGVTAVLYALGRDPVGWVKDKYYEIRGTYVAVETVGYQADPATSVVRGYSPAALGTPEPDDAWATAWDPGRRTPTAGCDGRSAALGKVRLTFAEPVRVRRLEVVAGLPGGNERRPLQFRPKRMYVVYQGGCSTVELRDTADVQKIDLDTTAPVGAITLAIAETYPARPDAPQFQVALTTVTPLARPH